jgi:hypothetical protein
VISGLPATKGRQEKQNTKKGKQTNNHRHTGQSSTSTEVVPDPRIRSYQYRGKQATVLSQPRITPTGGGPQGLRGTFTEKRKVVANQQSNN